MPMLDSELSVGKLAEEGPRTLQAYINLNGFRNTYFYFLSPFPSKAGFYSVPGLDLNSQQPTCLSLPSVGILCLCHNAQINHFHC